MDQTESSKMMEMKMEYEANLIAVYFINARIKKGLPLDAEAIKNDIEDNRYLVADILSNNIENLKRWASNEN